MRLSLARLVVLTSILETGVLGSGGRPLSPPRQVGIGRVPANDGTGESLAALVRQVVPPERGSPAATRMPDLAGTLRRQLAAIHKLATVRAVGFSPVEHLVALRPDGTVLWQLRGESGFVRIGPEADAALYESDAGVVLVHNHPTGASLSLADLANLAKPGVSAMVVIGHDGSVYMAERGGRYDGVRLAGSLHELVRRTVLDQLDRDRPSTRLASAVIDSHADHLVLLALHEAGVLRYQSILAAARRRSYADSQRHFSRAIEAARGRVQGAMR